METMRRVRNPPLLTAAMITVLFEDPPSELLGGPGEELDTVILSVKKVHFLYSSCSYDVTY